MDYRSLVGQRMVVGFHTTQLNDEIKQLIREYKISNIILFQRNIEGKKQLKELCHEIQSEVKKSTGYDAFIMIDEEGGTVSRLGNEGIHIPGAMALGAIAHGALENEEDIYEAGKLMGIQLSRMGINFNLAPVLDVNSNPNNPVIGVRSFGDCPEKVASYGVAMATGLMEGGVYPCGKHFPGHGDTDVDSHVGLPVIDKTMDELMREELIPFKKGIEVGIPAIMTTHILYPRIEESNVPATMSKKIIKGLLREKLQFRGLIISDCLEMDAIKVYYGVVHGAVKTIDAGVDLILVCHTYDTIKNVSDGLVKALEDKELSINEMRSSVERILYYKVQNKENLMEKMNRYNNFELEIVGTQIAKDMIRRSFTKVSGDYEKFILGDRPLFVGVSPFKNSRASSDNNELHFVSYLKDAIGGNGDYITMEPTEDEIRCIEKQVTKATSIIIGSFNSHMHIGQQELIHRVSKLCKYVMVFALGNPYDFGKLPNNIVGIATYEYSKYSLEIIKEVLVDKFIFQGKIPVKLS